MTDDDFDDNLMYSNDYDSEEVDENELIYKTPNVTFEIADRLRCSRRVLFEKVASKPNEYLTVLTGFNWNLLVAFAWECCDYLEKHCYGWHCCQQEDDDSFDWVISYYNMQALLNALYRKSNNEIYFLEWNVLVTLDFRDNIPSE